MDKGDNLGDNSNQQKSGRGQTYERKKLNNNDHKKHLEMEKSNKMT